MSEVIAEGTMLCAIFEKARAVERKAFEVRENPDESWGIKEDYCCQKRRTANKGWGAKSRERLKRIC